MRLAKSGPGPREYELVTPEIEWRHHSTVVHNASIFQDTIWASGHADFATLPVQDFFFFLVRFRVPRIYIVQSSRKPVENAIYGMQWQYMTMAEWQNCMYHATTS